VAQALLVEMEQAAQILEVVVVLLIAALAVLVAVTTEINPHLVGVAVVLVDTLRPLLLLRQRHIHMLLAQAALLGRLEQVDMLGVLAVLVLFTLRSFINE
jgi:hypothetical protein